MPTVPYQHLKTPTNVGSGISDMLLFAPVADFATDGIKCPVPPETGATLADLVTIAGPHLFQTGKGFIELLCAPFKNQINAGQIGEVGSKKFDINLECFIAGSYADLHGTIAQLNNTPIIALVKDSNCASGMYYQLGCDCLFAYASAEFATGTTKDGQKGYKIMINVPADSIHIYTGTVTMLGDVV